MGNHILIICTVTTFGSLVADMVITMQLEMFQTIIWKILC